MLYLFLFFLQILLNVEEIYFFKRETVETTKGRQGKNYTDVTFGTGYHFLSREKNIQLPIDKVGKI